MRAGVIDESVLDEFVRMLDQFDEAVALGNDGRTDPDHDADWTYLLPRPYQRGLG